MLIKQDLRENLSLAFDTLRGHKMRSMLAVLGALSAFGPLSTDMYLPGLPAMARDLHTTESSAQLTLSACLIGLAIGQLFAGPFSDALGRRHLRNQRLDAAIQIGTRHLSGALLQHGLLSKSRR